MEITPATSIKDRSELAEVYENFDDDRFDQQSNLTNIDFNTNLPPNFIALMARADEVHRKLGVDSSYTRIIKRLYCSRKGWGREGKIRMAIGRMEQSGAGGVRQRLLGLFQRG